MSLPISWEALTALSTVVSVTLSVWMSLRSQAAKQYDMLLNKIEDLRNAAELNRNALYSHMGDMIRELRQEFASKDTNLALSGRIDALERRLDISCSTMKRRSTDHD